MNILEYQDSFENFIRRTILETFVDCFMFAYAHEDEFQEYLKSLKEELPDDE